MGGKTAKNTKKPEKRSGTEPTAQQHPAFCAGGSSRPNGSGETPFRCLLPSVQHANQGWRMLGKAITLIVFTRYQIVADVIPYPTGGPCQSFVSLYPANFFLSFQFAMVEDLINSPPFTCFDCWLRDQELSWDGSLGRVHSTPHQRLMQRTAAGQQAGAHSERHCPKIWLTLRGGAAQRGRSNSYREVASVGQGSVVCGREDCHGKLRGLRKTCLGMLQELHRQWACISGPFVTAKRDLGFLGLLVILTLWSDVSLPMAFIQGMPAVGYSPPCSLAVSSALTVTVGLGGSRSSQCSHPCRG